MTRRVAALPAWVLAAVLAAAYLIVQPPSADLAAQLYRTELFEREGFAIWDNAWYAGHHLPGYSVLFPPLAIVAVGFLIALLVTGRRRSDQKYAGLRILR